MFSWGFSGWGTATRQLVAAMDAAEEQRGFKPPMFADIRLRREGCAPEFRGETEFVAIPWGTLVMLQAGRDQFPVAVGPAAYRAETWVLPRFHDQQTEPGQELQPLRRQVARLRREYGLD
jgi:hypothetical protein